MSVKKERGLGSGRVVRVLLQGVDAVDTTWSDGGEAGSSGAGGVRAAVVVVQRQSQACVWRMMSQCVVGVRAECRADDDQGSPLTFWRFWRAGSLREAFEKRSLVRPCQEEPRHVTGIAVADGSPQRGNVGVQALGQQHARRVYLL